jgi:hypothetical protein
VLLAVHVGVVLQLDEYELSSLHSQPYVTVGVFHDTFGALCSLCVAASVMPVVSVGLSDPYSAPSRAAFATKR